MKKYQNRFIQKISEEKESEVTVDNGHTPK